jgi:hypothetical protein
MSPTSIATSLGNPVVQNLTNADAQISENNESQSHMNW